MKQIQKQFYAFYLIIIALAGWLIPGAGYLLLGEKKRAVIIFIAITLTFTIGIYIASVSVIDYVDAKLWFIAQVLNSPLVIIIGSISAGLNNPVYGRTYDIGQIYTSVAGLLNLLCIVNSVHFAYNRSLKTVGGNL
jgi:hypothetical protein